MSEVTQDELTRLTRMHRSELEAMINAQARCMASVRERTCATSN